MTAAHCQDVAQHTVDVARARNDRPGMVLQAFGWSQASRSDNCTADCLSGPYPTLDQQRRMREFAVRGGVNFVLWFDLFYVQPLGTWDVGRLDQLAKAIP